MIYRIQPNFLKYYAIIKVNFLNTTIYKIEFITQTFKNVFMIFIFNQLYKATFTAARVSQFEGLDLVQILWLLTLIRIFYRDWETIQLVNQEIRSGDLAYTMNRPYSYILLHYFSFWGRNLLRIIIDFFTHIIPAYFLFGKISISIIGMTATIFTIILGISLEFLIQIIIAFCTFWIEDITGLKWIMSKIVVILGGTMIPIDMYPPILKTIIGYFPFVYLFYNAAKLAVNFTALLFYKTALLQLFWIVTLTLLATLILNKGMKNISINGG